MKEVKKPVFGNGSKEDPSKVGNLDLKATFGKLAAKHAPPKGDDEMKNEAQKTSVSSDAKADDKGGVEDEKEVKKSVRIKLPEEDDTSSKGKCLNTNNYLLILFEANIKGTILFNFHFSGA